MKSIRPGQALMGERAPSEGYLVEVTPTEMYSAAFRQMLFDWIGNSVMCRFQPGQERLTICVNAPPYDPRDPYGMGPLPWYLKVLLGICLLMGVAEIVAILS